MATAPSGGGKPCCETSFCRCIKCLCEHTSQVLDPARPPPQWSPVAVSSRSGRGRSAVLQQAVRIAASQWAGSMHEKPMSASASVPFRCPWPAPSVWTG